jgi:hypothetical protein
MSESLDEPRFADWDERTRPEGSRVEPARFEFKLPLANRTPAGVWSTIRRHPLAFEEHHPPRRINNIYFDTPALTCFQTSIAGVSRRLKLRLRWYGDDDGVDHGALEWKWRAGKLGWKWTRPVAWEGELAKWSWTELRARLRAELNGRERATFDALAIPTLLNRYRRRYFISRDRRCRLTLDEDLSFNPQLGNLRPRTRFAIPAPRLRVLELKVSQTHSVAVREALQGFPYRSARFSKYTTGLELFLATHTSA